MSARCTVRDCSEGIAGHPECNGWGKVSPRGGTYRRKCREIPAWAVDCAGCNGTGMVACGCTELGELERAILAGTGAELMARRELDALEEERRELTAAGW